ncbi:hypothetical protein C8R47DRAFT_1294470 [Mycena vitilis]|nr:hypothetical protein C8R47DRAFT_1294470 [Mycena vitilis]
MDSRDSRYCSGDTGSSQCRCHRFVQRPGTDNCTCEHPEGYHPDPMPHTATGTGTTASAPTVTTPSTASIMASYLAPSTILKGKAKSIPSSSSNRPPVASSSKTRLTLPSKSSKHSVSNADALAETHAGMKRKAGKLENIEDKPKKRSRKGKEIAMGEVILVVTAGDKGRKRFVTPSVATVADLESRNLAVNGLRSALSFGLEWDDYRMDIWFRKLFPDYFFYVDLHYPIDSTEYPPKFKFQWQLLIRNKQELSVSPNLADAQEFHRYLSTTPDLRKIFIGVYH